MQFEGLKLYYALVALRTISEKSSLRIRKKTWTAKAITLKKAVKSETPRIKLLRILMLNQIGHQKMTKMAGKLMKMMNSLSSESQLMNEGAQLIRKKFSCLQSG
mmetsp:Transcript_5683/g.5386  ORF Transcript_5683/g.5386 Transcript_5683/m.5386 type:complete len:104 (+) Transcript_5683:304-615(+)